MDCGCKEREEIVLTYVEAGKSNRRGFLWNLAHASVGIAAAYTLGATTLKAQVAVAHQRDAVRFLRWFNTAQHRHFAQNGYFAPLDVLLRSAAMEGFRQEPRVEELWGEFFDLKNHNEVVIGWQLYHSQEADGQTYSTTLKTTGSGSYTYTTDEKGVISTGKPLALRGEGLLGRFASMFAMKCLGPNGVPWCCCGPDYEPCCDQSHCCSARVSYGNCFNCGCGCCPWCETAG